MARERRAGQWMVEVTKAETIRDPAQRDLALSQIVENPDFVRTMGGNGPRSQALFQKWGQMTAQMSQNNAALDRVDAAGRNAAAVARMRAGAGARLPQFLFEKMSKIAQAKGDLDALEKAYSSGNWGPILGRIKGLNPYAADKDALNSLASAAVPNLARGVFGEVGVLTEADFENYKRMLPNIKTPEASMKVLVEILNAKLSAVYGQTVKRAKGQGYNTAGFEDDLGSEMGDVPNGEDVLNLIGPAGGP